MNSCGSNKITNLWIFVSHFVISLNVFLSSEMLLEQVEFLANIHILQLLQAVISLLLSFFLPRIFFISS